MDYFTHRRTALARTLAADNLAAILITHPANVRYLCGFTGSAGYLALTPNKSILVSDARYTEQIREEVSAGVEVEIRPHTEPFAAATARVLTQLGAGRVGLEADHATLAFQAQLSDAGPKLRFVPLTGRVETLRAIKDAGEVEHIREAVRVAERAFRMFLAFLTASDTEKELADALESYLRRAGARGSAFAPIVAVGERGALPHSTPSQRIVADGSKLLIDWGADLGYKSDLTRTFRSPFGASLSRKHRPERMKHNFEQIHAAVLSAHEAAAATLRSGVLAAEVDRAARRELVKVKLKGNERGTLDDYFTHGLGHGIGLEVHEEPDIRSTSTGTLAAGMVVTIEPGVYLPGWGGVRIEDDYLVTDDGGVRLSTLPRDPVFIT